MHGMALPPNKTLMPAKSVQTHSEWASVILCKRLLYESG